MAMATALIIVAACAASAQAAKVANPGSVTFRFESGTLAIGSETFEAASSDDPATATGSVNANGSISISSFNFPDLPPVEGPLGDVNISINVQSASGNVNPHTGAMTMSATVRVDADGGGVGGDCHVGPINLNLSTATSGGVPYNTANGNVTLADRTFAVPGASGCSTFPVNVNNLVNDELGLPSGSGNNDAVLTARSVPILQKAIVPAFTTTPSTGSAPLPVTFDASSTFHSRPVASYAWDFDNNGTFDASSSSPTAAFTYASPGTKTVRLRVTDADGDSQETTRTVIVNPAPDLTIGKSHSGDFVSGETGTYSVAVTNTGSFPATDTITVTDTLPADMAFSGHTGEGWSCSAADNDVTCTSEDDLASGAAATPLSIDVVPGPASVGFVTNIAAVDVAGDANASNDVAEDVTRVLQAGIDLQITKAHDQQDGFFRGQRTTYLIDVANVGTAPAVDRVRVADDLPAGVEFVSAAGGLDWTCSYVAPALRCFTDNDVAGGESLDQIRVRVEVAADAPSEVLNTATVSVNGDTGDDNNSATHAATVTGFATDYALELSHSGDFVAGAPGFYTVSVRNVGSAAGGNPVTVLDQLPPGLSFESAAGDGWSCAANGQDVTCGHAGEVEAGEALPSLTLRVQVDESAAPGVVNTAGLASADDFNVANDVDADETAVRAPAPDLSIVKEHDGNFLGGSQGTYRITVSNDAPEPAPGPTTVTDQLPAGLTFVSASGDGWGCAHESGTVTCTRGEAIDAGSSAPVIEVVVTAARSASGTTVVNVATLANGHDTTPADNTASDPTVVADPQAPTELVADPLLLKLSTEDGKGLRGPTAHLKSGGLPLAGKTITFTNAGSGSVLCTAVTDASGKASCGPQLKWLLALQGNGHYNAAFAGDADYKPATAKGDVIRVFGIAL
jgi:uncharacterized repeat protein (TIGR01451 family)